MQNPLPTADLWPSIADGARSVVSVGVFVFLWRLDRRVARVEQSIHGADGKNGLASKVGDLHKWRNDFQQQALERALAENRRLQTKLDHQKEE